MGYLGVAILMLACLGPQLGINAYQLTARFWGPGLQAKAVGWTVALVLTPLFCATAWALVVFVATFMTAFSAQF